MSPIIIALVATACHARPGSDGRKPDVAALAQADAAAAGLTAAPSTHPWPEVLVKADGESSDCGVAVTRALLQHFGLTAAAAIAQLDRDGGTSIDSVEERLSEVGVAAPQEMLPVEHLFVAGVDWVPAVLITQDQAGIRHFVIVWRKDGATYTVMDPHAGTRQLSAAQLRSMIYVHEMEVAGDGVNAWLHSADFRDALSGRLRALGVSPSSTDSMITRVRAVPGWQTPAALDAAVRLAEQNPAQHGDITSFIEKTWEIGAATQGAPEPRFWTARATGATGKLLMLRGAVILRHIRRANP